MEDLPLEKLLIYSCIGRCCVRDFKLPTMRFTFLLFFLLIILTWVYVQRRRRGRVLSPLVVGPRATLGHTITATSPYLKVQACDTWAWPTFGTLGNFKFATRRAVAFIFSEVFCLDIGAAIFSKGIRNFFVLKFNALVFRAILDLG